jgi:hypothetical protein
MGYGGNGIAFSRIAAEIVRADLTGATDADAALFAFEAVNGPGVPHRASAAAVRESATPRAREELLDGRRPSGPRDRCRDP